MRRMREVAAQALWYRVMFTMVAMSGTPLPISDICAVPGLGDGKGWRVLFAAGCKY